MNALPASEVIIEFVGHVGLAVVGFLIICAAAIVLELSTRYIHSGKLLPAVFVFCIRGLAYALFLADLIGFVYFIAVLTWNLLGDIHGLIR